MERRVRKSAQGLAHDAWTDVELGEEWLLR